MKQMSKAICSASFLQIQPNRIVKKNLLKAFYKTLKFALMQTTTRRQNRAKQKTNNDYLNNLLLNNIAKLFAKNAIFTTYNRSLLCR